MSLFILHFSLTLFWVMIIGHEWYDFLVGFIIGGAIVTFGDNFWYANHVEADVESKGKFRIYPLFIFLQRDYLQKEFRLMGRFLRRMPVQLLLIVFFLSELMKSTLGVMKRVIQYQSEIQSGIVAVELACDRDFEIVLLSALITLSPGTLTVDERFDEETQKRYLYVHVLHMPDHSAAIEDIKRLETRILQTLYGRNYRVAQEEK